MAQGLCDEVIALVVEVPPSLRTRLTPTAEFLQHWGAS